MKVANAVAYIYCICIT